MSDNIKTDPQEQARILSEALPHMQRYDEETIVIKYGGHAMGDDTLARHKPGRSLQSNIEMNAALLLDAVGVPRDAFTQVFAIARSAGWLANALEQQKTGRMIRPASNYIGPKPGN